MTCKHMHKDFPENAVCEDYNNFENWVESMEGDMKGGKENGRKSN